MVVPETPDMFSAATAPLTFHDFLERMKHPAAADLVRSIKSFMVQFMARPPQAEEDSRAVQTFLAETEQAFRSHSLWAGASAEELESAGEGLEKYVMTKLYSRAFSPLPEDIERDRRLSEKIAALQQFVQPEHLDIPSHFRNEASLLLAQKELQKIGSFKAPRDKLVCILNCCRVINNLLLNASLGSTGEATPPGADDFLPVLIYVLLKANPPQLQATIAYIQHYRHESRLVSESAYFFTNLVSAATFLENIDAKSLSMSASEFEANMEAAKKVLALDIAPPAAMVPTDQGKREVSAAPLPPPPPPPPPPSQPPLAGGGRNLTDIEAELSRDYRFAFAKAADLRVGDVELLLTDYKELVLKYTLLLRATTASPAPAEISPSNVQTQNSEEKVLQSAQDAQSSGPRQEDAGGAEAGGAGGGGGGGSSLESFLFDGLSITPQQGGNEGEKNLQEKSASAGEEVEKRESSAPESEHAKDELLIPDELKALEQALAQTSGGSKS